MAGPLLWAVLAAGLSACAAAGVGGGNEEEPEAKTAGGVRPERTRTVQKDRAAPPGKSVEAEAELKKPRMEAERELGR